MRIGRPKYSKTLTCVLSDQEWAAEHIDALEKQLEEANKLIIESNAMFTVLEVHLGTMKCGEYLEKYKENNG